MFRYPVTPAKGAANNPQVSFGFHLNPDKPDFAAIDDFTVVWWDSKTRAPDETGADGTGVYRYVFSGYRLGLAKADIPVATLKAIGIDDPRGPAVRHEELARPGVPRTHRPRPAVPAVARLAGGQGRLRSRSVGRQVLEGMPTWPAHGRHHPATRPRRPLRPLRGGADHAAGSTRTTCAGSPSARSAPCRWSCGAATGPSRRPTSSRDMHDRLAVVVREHFDVRALRRRQHAQHPRPLPRPRPAQGRLLRPPPGAELSTPGAVSLGRASTAAVTVAADRRPRSTRATVVPTATSTTMVMPSSTVPTPSSFRADATRTNTRARADHVVRRPDRHPGADVDAGHRPISREVVRPSWKSPKRRWPRAAGGDQRDGLHEVGADQLRRPEARVEEQQQHDHERAGADRGHADDAGRRPRR